MVYPATPREIALVKGNPGKRSAQHLNRGAHVAPSLPKAPPYLHPYARQEWRRVAKQLYELGVLTELDQNSLGAYCQAFAQWRLAWDEHKARGYDMTSREGGALLRKTWDALDVMRKLMTEFGLTPASRTRVQPQAKPAHDEHAEERKARKFFG